MLKSTYLRYALFMAFILAAAGCSQVPAVLSQPSQSLEEQAQTRAAQQDYAEAARLYQLAGESAAEPRRSHLLLDGADAALQASNPELGGQLLNAIDLSRLDENAQVYFELLQRQRRIAGMPAAEALKLLPPPASGAPPKVAARVWALRAGLFYKNGQITQATHALVQRNVWLLDEDQIQANNNLLWERLRKQPPAPDAQPPAGDATTQGWLALARIAGQAWPDRAALESELQHWNRRYPGHPAALRILPERFDFAPSQIAQASRLALALPLTGPFANAGAAIQDGFMAGYYASKDRAGSAATLPSILVYDSNALSNPGDLIRNIRGDRVDLLVGPLQKDLATELAQRGNLGIPMLALNYTQAQVNVPNFYQFGLAPEDEARAAAQRAQAMGLRTAVALVPQGEWGTRVLQAFRDALNQAGGELIDYDRFDPRTADHAEPIKRVLRYNQAQALPAAQASPGSPNSDQPNSETAHRRNVDFIFVAAQPAQARQIRQQLRYYHASRLPVLATSHVYSGTVNTSKDGDLEGVIFADMPWIIGSSSEIQTRRENARRTWPNTNEQYPRLFAMGYDAWLLAEKLSRDQFRQGLLLQGNTGDLYLQPDGRIERELDWAQFQSGRPRALQAPAPRSGPVSY